MFKFLIYLTFAYREEQHAFTFLVALEIQKRTVDNDPTVREFLRPFDKVAHLELAFFGSRT